MKKRKIQQNNSRQCGIAWFALLKILAIKQFAKYVKTQGWLSRKPKKWPIFN